MQNTPHQAQKTIFAKFEQWGMGLDMFWWSNGVKLQNLSLIHEMMVICEKDIDTLSIGNIPEATKLSWFWPKNAVSNTGTWGTEVGEKQTDNGKKERTQGKIVNFNRY